MSQLYESILIFFICCNIPGIYIATIDVFSGIICHQLNALRAGRLGALVLCLRRTLGDGSRAARWSCPAVR